MITPPDTNRQNAYADNESGISLVEVVVALGVVGAMLAAVMLSLGGMNWGGSAETEAQLLAARINLAADMVLIEGKTVDLTWDGDGYSLGEAGERHDVGPGLELIGPAPEGVVAISSGVSAVAFTIQGGESASRVEFDGLAASVSQVSKQ